VIEVDFSDADKGGLLSAIRKVTSLQAPHRIADAILRDSLLDGKAFRHTDEGKCLDTVSLANATALYNLCPTALVFGMWDSTGPKGGLGAKFQRAMVSEIVGIDAVYGVKTSSRIDPLQIARNAGPLYRSAGNGDIGWTLDEAKAAKDEKTAIKLGKDGRPSEANHGNIVPSLSSVDRDGRPLAGGVTIASAEQVVVLSLPALRRLGFPLDKKDAMAQAKVNAAGRTVLAALGLCAAALAAEKGFDLRSRCLLWPSGPMEWELLDRPGQPAARLTLEAGAAIDVLTKAVTAAEKLGLKWQTKPLVLKPAPQLVELVKKSQALAAAAGGEEEGE
jgi:CRISPR-associated protein Csb1